MTEAKKEFTARVTNVQALMWQKGFHREAVEAREYKAAILEEGGEMEIDMVNQSFRALENRNETQLPDTLSNNQLFSVGLNRQLSAEFRYAFGQSKTIPKSHILEHFFFLRLNAGQARTESAAARANRDCYHDSLGALSFVVLIFQIFVSALQYQKLQASIDKSLGAGD